MLGVIPLLHGTVICMYNVFIVIVNILRLFFILYGNTASYLQTYDFSYSSSYFERYILKVCIDFLGVPFHNDDALVVNLPFFLSEDIITN